MTNPPNLNKIRKKTSDKQILKNQKGKEPAWQR